MTRTILLALLLASCTPVTVTSYTGDTVGLQWEPAPADRTPEVRERAEEVCGGPVEHLRTERVNSLSLRYSFYRCLRVERRTTSCLLGGPAHVIMTPR